MNGYDILLISGIGILFIQSLRKALKSPCGGCSKECGQCGFSATRKALQQRKERNVK